VVELDVVVTHWLMATLADLTITANDLQHDFPRDHTGMRA
jgi:hypothetical protein